MPNYSFYQQASEILNAFHNSLLEQDLERWLGLFEEEAVFEFPYAPEDFPKRLTGKAEIRAHIEELPNLLKINKFSCLNLYTDSNKSTIIAEYNCDGTATQTGKPYMQTYISVIELHDGKIKLFKDYWNPLIVLDSIQS